MKQIGILFQPEMVKANVEGRKWMTRRLRDLQPINADPDKWHLWQPKISEESGVWAFTTNPLQGEKGEIVHIKCPYGKTGDMMWQRETFCLETNYNIDDESVYPPPFNDGRPVNRIVDHPVDGDYWEQPHYKATDPTPELCFDGREEPGVRWTPSIHMPRWASRFVRPITRIRCERVQSIDQGDAISEGMVALSRDKIFELFPDYAKEYEERSLDSRSRPPLGPSPRDRFEALWRALNGAESWDRNYWVWVIEYAKESNETNRD